MAFDVFDLYAKIGLDQTEYDNGLDEARGKLATLGGAITESVTAAAKAGAAFASSAVQVGMGFDASMAQVAATMGKTMSEIELETGHAETAFGSFDGTLREFAQFLGANTAFSASQAADALNYMALAGYSTQQSMDMLPNVLNLAAAGAMDLARASDMVTDTQSAFGITAERTTQMVDEMAKAASTGNTSVEQLGDAFLIVGGLAKEMNGGFITLSDGSQAAVDGIQELEIALTAMANAGVKGSEAGTHMRNMLLKLSSPTDDGVKAMEAMGVAVFDTEGNMRSLSQIFGDLSEQLDTMSQQDKIQTISELFNARDIASAEALLAAVEQDWDSIGESILDAQGAAAQMANTQLDSLAGDLTIFRSALEGAQIALADKLIPTIREFVQFATDGLSKLTTAFKADGVKGAMNALAEIVEDGVVMIADMLPKFMETGGMVIAAIGKGIVNAAPTLIAKGAEAMKDLSRGVAASLPDVIRAAGSLISETVSFVAQNLPMVLRARSDIRKTAAKAILDALPEIIKATREAVRQIGDTVVKEAPVLIAYAKETVGEIISGARTILPEILNAARGIIASVAEGMRTNASDVRDTVRDIISSVATFISDNIPIVLNAGREIILSVAQGVIENASIMAEAIGQIALSIAGFIAENMASFIEAGISIIAGIAAGIWENRNDIAYNLGNALGATIDNLVTLIAPYAGQLLLVGGYIIGEIITGIVNNLPKVLDVAGQFVAYFAQGLGDALPQISFLTDIISMIGENLETIAPIALGVIGAFKGFQIIQPILSGISNIISAFPEILAAITSPIGIAVAAIAALIGAFVYLYNTNADFASNMQEKWEGIKAAFSQMVDGLKPSFDRIIKAFDTIMQTLEPVFEWIFNVLAGAVTGVINAIDPIVDAVADGIDYLKELISFVAALLSGDFEGALQHLVNAGEFLYGFWEGLFRGLVEVVKGLLDGMGILDFLKRVGQAFVDFGIAVSEGWKELGRRFNAWITGIKDTITGWVDSVGRSLTGLWNIIVEVNTRILDGIREWLASILRAVSGKWDEIRESTTRAWQSIVSGIVEKASAIKSTIESRIGEAVSFFKELPGKAMGWGRDLIDSFVGGIKEKIQAVKDTVIGIADDIKSFLGFSEPERGPLSNFHTYAPDMMRLFAEGIKENEGLVTSQLERSFDFSDVLADQTVSVNAQGAYTTGAMGATNVTMNIYGAEGQDVRQLAEIISQRMDAAVSRRQMARGAV